MSNFHNPVMRTQAVDLLNVQDDQIYLDCNLGGGGHTQEIINRGGKVIGLDLDIDALTEVLQKLELNPMENSVGLFAGDEQLKIYQTNFTKINEVVSAEKVDVVAGVLFDLGISSHQVDEGSRGFSFNKKAPLDMRMDKNAQIPTAADLIHVLHEKELADLFYKLGDEYQSKVIAKAIVNYRRNKKITNTLELAEIIDKAKRDDGKKTHAATKVFQALRIAVNDELNNLKEALPQAFEVLKPGGRIVVISFHSLEDGIVKEYFDRLISESLAKRIGDELIEPNEEEIHKNIRSRSARMRVIEKI